VPLEAKGMAPSENPGHARASAVSWTMWLALRAALRVEVCLLVLADRQSGDLATVLSHQPLAELCRQPATELTLSVGDALARYGEGHVGTKAPL
jgi:hypothetical protein